MTKQTIALLGGTGDVGGHFLEKALSAGYQIKALVRDKSKLADGDDLQVFQGDARDAQDVAGVIEGVDFVVSAVGNPKNMLIMDTTAKNILAAAKAQPTPPKCEFVSSLGCHGTAPALRFVFNLLGYKKSYDDYDKADALIISQNEVPYVLIRPSRLKEVKGNGKYDVYPESNTFARYTAKEDLAQFLLDALQTDKWDNQGGFQIQGVHDK